MDFLGCSFSLLGFRAGFVHPLYPDQDFRHRPKVVPVQGYKSAN